MAVLPMKKIHIFAHKSDKQSLLKTLQNIGVVQISDIDYENLQINKQDLSLDIATIDRQITSTNSALGILSTFSKTKSPMFFTKPVLSSEQYFEFKNENEKIIDIVSSINAKHKQTIEDSNNIARINAQIINFLPWSDFSLPLSFIGTKYTKSFIGTIPNVIEKESLINEFSTINTCVLEIISSSDEQYYIFALSHNDDAESLEELLRKLSFSHLSFNRPPHSANDEIHKLKNHINDLENDIAKKNEDIASFVSYINNIKFLYDYLLVQKEKHETSNKSVETNSSFILSGFVPENSATQVANHIEANFSAGVDLCDPDEDEPVPVLFSNNGFTSPVETVVDMFSLPGRQDVDPVPIMAPFYYIFFGLMLSDAAYGIILVAITSFLLLKKKVEGQMKKMVKLFFYCGISTIFWGAMLGSWFGDIVKVVSKTFFNNPNLNIPAVLFNPVNDPIPLLLFSLALGFVHLMTAMGIKFYNLTKHGKLKEAIYDVGFWMLLLIGLVLLSFFKKTGITMSIIGTLGLLLTQGRASKNIVARLFLGLYSIYGITGYLSDVLSYSRLLALGLATGVIAMVVNTIGALSGGGIKGAIVFTIVFILGHAMNIFINTLGAYVHSSRLQYVEFFNKFYEGGGQAFCPFAINTKYTKFKEE